MSSDFPTYNLSQKHTSASVSYLSKKEHAKCFFTEKLKQVVSEMGSKLNSATQINVYPDATLKTNKLPTGIACVAKPEDSILLPNLLRDPGCGFLIFKIDFTEAVDANYQIAAGKLLETIINDKNSLPANEFSMAQWKAILIQGLHALDLTDTELDLCTDKVFEPLLDCIDLSNDELEMLKVDFLSVTNSVEIRKPFNITNTSFGINENSLIGFIHTGSFAFPEILGRRFVYRIAEYADINNLFTIDDIKAGIYGVKFESDLGKEYYSWVRAGMNYALVNRYSIFQRIKLMFEETFSCTITLLNDTVHAGVFNKDESIHSVRGAQPITKNTLRIIAGQRETIAALVANFSNEGGFIPHGTGYHVKEDFNYNEKFSDPEANQYLEFAINTFYNSIPEYDNCLTFTFNLLATLDYLRDTGVCQSIALLAPYINIQSDWVKSS